MLDGDHGPSMNGVLMEQQQLVQQPPLCDMDLERMQTELFKGRYLIPKDFLDDVGKILWNAEVRQHEDLDRLHKAQAMFTAAEVSIQEFDPQLRVDCRADGGQGEAAQRGASEGKGKGQGTPEGAERCCGGRPGEVRGMKDWSPSIGLPTLASWSDS